MSAFGNEAQQRRLAEELKRLRLVSGLSGKDLGAQIGVEQSTVSRIENGKQRTSVPHVIRWLEATGASPERTAEIAALAEKALTGPTSWAEAGETDSTNFARDTQDLEAKTGLLSFYQPASIPGLLQTPAYARRLLSSGPQGVPDDLAQRVMGRMERQQVLYDEGKRFRFVIPEAALRWPYGPAGDPAVLDEHREQLARVEWATRRPNIELGILPMSPVAVWRLSGFVIYDEVSGGDPLVHIEWLTRPYNEAEPEALEMCRQAFANLLGASVTGDEARRLIGAAADDLRAFR
jgi:transcriptional regulator with XRE-family HTH domain